MPTPYKGATIPLPTDLADGPKAFQDYTDSLPTAEAVVAVTIPAGTVAFTCRTVAPTGWVLLDGTTLVGAQTTYPNLWNAVPAAWRSGADIILPNCKGRMVIGLDPANTAIDAPGDLTGSATIAAADLPPHTHTQQGTVTSGGQSTPHVHVTAGSFVNTQPGGGVYAGGIGGSPASFTANNNVDHTHGVTLSGETGNGPGTSTPHLPPVLALNVMMRAS